MSGFSNSAPPSASTQPPTRVLANKTYTVNDYSQVVLAARVILDAGASIVIGTQSQLVRIIG